MVAAWSIGSSDECRRRVWTYTLQSVDHIGIEAVIRKKDNQFTEVQIKARSTDDEHAAVTRAVHRRLDDDRYPLVPRLAPLRSALAKLDPASVPKVIEART